MKKILVAFFVICFLVTSFGQNKKKDLEVDIIDHQVQLGESIRLISKKYLVDPAEIYKLNKFAVEGISQGMVLKIPVPKKEGTSSEAEINIKNEEIVVNQSSQSGVKETEINNNSLEPLPVKEEVVKESQNPNNDIKKIVITERKTEVNHKVTPKETLYSLARDFNVSVDDIKANNPEVLKSGLQIGQTIKIPTEKSIDIKQSTSINETGTSTIALSKVTNIRDKSDQNQTEVDVKYHKVLPKETLYTLSKKYNVSIDDIKMQNELLLKNGLQIGQVLIIKTNN